MSRGTGSDLGSSRSSLTVERVHRVKGGSPVFNVLVQNRAVKLLCFANVKTWPILTELVFLKKTR